MAKMCSDWRHMPSRTLPLLPNPQPNWTQRHIQASRAARQYILSLSALPPTLDWRAQ